MGQRLRRIGRRIRGALTAIAPMLVRITGVTWQPVLALVLIGAGAYAMYPPAGPLAVGALLWVDLFKWTGSGKS